MRRRKKILSATLAAVMFLFSAIPSALGIPATMRTIPEIHKVTKFKNPNERAQDSLTKGILAKLQASSQKDKGAKAKQAFKGLSADSQVPIIIKLNQSSAIVKAREIKANDINGKNLKHNSDSGKRRNTIQIDQSQVSANLEQQTKVLNNLQNINVNSIVKRHYTKAFNGYAAKVKLSDLDKIAAQSDVVAIYPDNQVNATDTQSVNSMVATAVYKADDSVTQLTGEGITVAVIDTGIDYSHPDLGGTIGVKVKGGYDFVNNDNDPIDDNGHGTHVAGIIAGLQDSNNPDVRGVAPGAKLLAYKVLDNYGSGSESNVIAGIEAAVEQGANIINLSLGSSNGFPDDPVSETINNAFLQGVLPVISAGNDGPKDHTDMGTINSPGTAISALTVAAMDANPTYPAVDFSVYSNVYDPSQSEQMTGFLMGQDFSSLTGQIELVDCGLGDTAEDFLDSSGNSIVSGKIALIQRGIEPFYTKLSYAMDSGAVAAIVFNTSDQDVVYPVLLDNDLNFIPAVGVLKYSDGNHLKQLIHSAPTVYPVKVEFGSVGTLMNPLYNQITDFSSRGLLPNYELKPDIAAPGANVLSLAPNNGYARMSGTSMAAPNVAGAVALLMQAHPDWSIGDYKVALMNTAKDLQFDAASQGAGLVQVDPAVHLKDIIFQFCYGPNDYLYKSGSVVFGAVGVDNRNLNMIDNSGQTWVNDAVYGESATTELKLYNEDNNPTSDSLAVTVSSVFKMNDGVMSSPLINNPVSLLLNNVELSNIGVVVNADPRMEMSLPLQIQIHDPNLAPGDYEMNLNVAEPNGITVHLPVVFSIPESDMFKNGVIDHPYLSPTGGPYSFLNSLGISFDVEQNIDGLKIEVYDENNQFVGTYLAADHSNISIWQKFGYILCNLNRGKYQIPFDGFILSNHSNGWTQLADGKYSLKVLGLKTGGSWDLSDDWVEYTDFGTNSETGKWITIDTHAPTINITQPTLTYLQTEDSKVTIIGTVYDPNLVDLMLYDSSSNYVGQEMNIVQGNFRTDVNLELGEVKYVELFAYDLAGNSSFTELTLEQVPAPGSYIPVSNITISPGTLKILSGSNHTIVATVSPMNATSKDLIWQSSNPDIAEVDLNGKVLAKVPGTTNITATASQDGIISNQCTVTVKNSSDGGNYGGSTTPTQTTVTGEVIDKRGEAVMGVLAQVTVEANGTSTVTVKSSEAIVLNQPDGKTSSLGDSTKLGFMVEGTAANNNNAVITLSVDGNIQVKNLANGTESKIAVTYDLGNGQKITIGSMDIKVGSNGEVSLTSTLIDPYGIITDSSTGKVITNADVTLYYANTARNIASGKTPDTIVQLPIISGFNPNNNKNPQVSDISGAYGFMVFPTSDYYITATKDGYDQFRSPTISVEQEIVKLDFKMNTPKTGLTRLAGLNSVDTALEIAKASYTGQVSNVILATAENFPDALAGSVLAYEYNAPILLVGSTEEEQNKVISYMKDHMNINGTVYILGGTVAVSSTVEEKIAASGFAHITRLGGIDRYETALKIADALDVKTGTPIVLVYGENYPDALSISSTAAVMQYPILLVQKDEITDSIKAEIAKIKPTKVYIIGLQAVVSTSVENQVSDLTSLDKGNIVRLGGVDRFETSLAVAKYFNLTGQNICIATGNNYPDALSGSVYAANSNVPIILVNGSLSDQAMNYLKTRKMTGATIFGGEAVVRKDIEQQLLKLMGNKKE